MKLSFFGLSASVYIRQLPGAWVAELLGVVLGVQDHKKDQIPLRIYSSLAAKGLILIKKIPGESKKNKNHYTLNYFYQIYNIYIISYINFFVV